MSSTNVAIQSSTAGENKKGAVQLKKEIGILQGISIIFGIIVGSGIFVSPVGVLRQTNSVGLSLVMWVVPGLFSCLGALVYAELGVRMQKSGGEYAYILQAFGGLPAFIVMWINFVVIGSVSCAANSLVFAEYILQPLYPNCVAPSSVIKMVAISGLSTLYYTILFFSVNLCGQLLQGELGCQSCSYILSRQNSRPPPNYFPRHLEFISW